MLDHFIAQATFQGLRVKAFRLSMEEFKILCRDPDATRYAHGRYDGVLIRIKQHNGASPWAVRQKDTYKIPISRPDYYPWTCAARY